MKALQFVIAISAFPFQLFYLFLGKNVLLLYKFISKEKSQLGTVQNLFSEKQCIAKCRGFEGPNLKPKKKKITSSVPLAKKGTEKF